MSRNIMRLHKLGIIGILLFIVIGVLPAIQYRTSDMSKGPIRAKNMYVPYAIFYNFPGLRAGAEDKYTLSYHLALYYTNDFFLDGIEQLTSLGTFGKYKEDYLPIVARDYESLTTELGISFSILKGLQVGVDLRLFSYYEGFLDSIIEGFHGAFGFPNGGREFKPRDEVEVNIRNNNNLDLTLNERTVAFGDIDLWVKYTFFERRRYAFAFMHALKLPTGSIERLSGSGYPDFALGLLADFKPVWILTFYVQTGLVVPLNGLFVYSNINPMFNGLIGVELNPFDFFSLIVQMNIKTAALSGPEIERYSSFTNDYDMVDNLALPQTNILVGLKFKYRSYLWQIYFEEDAFTNAGTDITIGLMFSHSINIGRFIY